jgi:uncharacterized protein YggL (DUF469 family)
MVFTTTRRGGIEVSNYYWSFKKDKEVYTESNDTIEQCIKEANEYNDFDVKHGSKSMEVVYIGKAIPFMIPVVDSECIFETFRDHAYDECGEASEDWLSGVSKEESSNLDEKLTEVIKKWMEETNNKPSFCTFESIDTYDLKTGLKLEKGEV